MRLRRSAWKWEVMIFRDTHTNRQTLHHNIFIVSIVHSLNQNRKRRRWSDNRSILKSQQNKQKQFQILFPLVCGDLECYTMVCPKVRAQANITVINSVCVEFKMRSQSVARLVHSLLQTNILSCLAEHNSIVKLPPMSSLLQSYLALNCWQTFQL